MTITELRAAHPELAEAYALSREQKLGPKRTAKALGLYVSTVKTRVYRARMLLGDMPDRRTNNLTVDERERIDAKITALGRCRCGLWLPCHSCPRSAAELADARPGAGATYPGPPL